MRRSYIAPSRAALSLSYSTGNGLRRPNASFCCEQSHYRERSELLQSARQQQAPLLEHGFACVRCDACAHESLLAFSCKARYFCPRCHERPGLLARLCRPVMHVSRLGFSLVAFVLDGRVTE